MSRSRISACISATCSRPSRPNSRTGSPGRDPDPDRSDFLRRAQVTVRCADHLRAAARGLDAWDRVGAAPGNIDHGGSGHAVRTATGDPGADQSGQALWLYPLMLILMFLMAGFTEEFFFRGFLQTRVEVLTGSPWTAVAIVTVLFSVYHLPYAYFNPMWPSAAIGSRMAGRVLQRSPWRPRARRSLRSVRQRSVPCILLRSMINAAPAMTMIKFGGAQPRSRIRSGTVDVQRGSTDPLCN